MFRRKYLKVLLVVLTLSAFFFAMTAESCSGQQKNAAVERADSQTVADQQGIYQRNQPIPIFNYSQQRQLLIEIDAAIANGASTYSVAYSFGKPIFVCESFGYPIPSTTQLTNPDQIIKQSDLHSDGGNVSVAQAEPVGTFTGQSAATYIPCLRNGVVTPVYMESEVESFPFKVKIVDGQVVDDGGDSSVSVPVHKTP